MPNDDFSPETTSDAGPGGSANVDSTGAEGSTSSSDGGQSASSTDGTAAAFDQAFGAADSPVPDTVSIDPAAQLRKELREANDRALRSQAELENFRKRSRREMEDERRYAALPLIRDLLGVMDNLERALAAAEKGDAAAGLLEGVRMVALQFNMCLEQYQCQRIPAVGASFDPHLHEAIAQQPSADHPPGTVMHVVRQGYRLHDRVVRPAQVIVSQASS